MSNEPTPTELAKLPRLDATAGIPHKDKILYLHFTLGAWHWYVAEYSGSGLFFGYFKMDGLAGWGTFSLDSLKNLSLQGKEGDRDPDWRLKRFSEMQM